MEKDRFFNQIQHQLIVSCQALKDEPLYGSEVMAKMAKAAEIGGAAAIRANGKDDILAIRSVTDLPIIGLIKRDYQGSEVYITPTIKELDELIDSGSDIIALDATKRTRPDGTKLHELLAYLKRNGKMAMADISSYEEGIHAEELGFHCVSTTLSGYTSYSRASQKPDFQLVERLSSTLSIPVLAEGRIHTPEQAKKALELGAYAVVVGSAITRPQEITRRFTNYLLKGGVSDDDESRCAERNIEWIN
jgi:N-acylglucosamine-6-phosphate 2-epimerase